MKKTRIPLFCALAAAALTALPAQAQSVYRCGMAEYTNNMERVRQGGCVPVSGGNLTIVRSSAMRAAHSTGGATVRRARATSRDMGRSSALPVARINDSEQRARDAGARTILQAELSKATARLAELRREYNNGEPEKMGAEFRNHQKYLDRVAELKASIARTESDIAGLRRELGRYGG